MSEPVLDAIRRRRVARAMTDEPVPAERLEAILEAARWAPTAGNRHLQRFVATTHSGVLRVGAGPVSSFSRAAVAVALAVPEGWSPEMIVCLGHVAPEQPEAMAPAHRLGWRDLTRWVPHDPPQ